MHTENDSCDFLLVRQQRQEFVLTVRIYRKMEAR